MHITADISILNDVYAQLTGSVSSSLLLSLSHSFYLCFASLFLLLGYLLSSYRTRNLRNFMKIKLTFFHCGSSFFSH